MSSRLLGESHHPRFTPLIRHKRDFLPGSEPTSKAGSRSFEVGAWVGVSPRLQYLAASPAALTQPCACPTLATRLAAASVRPPSSLWRHAIPARARLHAAGDHGPLPALSSSRAAVPGRCDAGSTRPRAAAAAAVGAVRPRRRRPHRRSLCPGACARSRGRPAAWRGRG